jgi:hypothetical protein
VITLIKLRVMRLAVFYIVWQVTGKKDGDEAKKRLLEESYEVLEDLGFAIKEEKQEKNK